MKGSQKWADLEEYPMFQLRAGLDTWQAVFSEDRPICELTDKSKSHIFKLRVMYFLFPPFSLSSRLTFRWTKRDTISLSPPSSTCTRSRKYKKARNSVLWSR